MNSCIKKQKQMYKILLKERDFWREKIRENAGKPKELWKAVKSLDLRSKITLASQISLEDLEKITLKEKQIITRSIIFILI